MPDESAPGIVELDVTAAAVEDVTRVVADALTAAIDRGVPFAAVIRTPPAPPRGVRLSGVTERVRTLKRLRPGLSAQCRGLAFVVTAETLQRQAKVIRSTDRMWGCPTLSTTDAAAARAWAASALESSGTTP